MYLNDCQRTAFYQGIGLNTKEFDMHVIIETNRTTAKNFPAVLAVENPEFKRKLDRMVEINQKLIAVGESDDEDEIKIVKSLPEPLREFASQFLIELASKAASSNLVFAELIKCSSKMGLSYLIPNAQVQMAPPVLHIPSRIVVFLSDRHATTKEMEVDIPDSSKLYSPSEMVESKSVGTFSSFQKQDSHRGLFVDLDLLG